MTRQEQEAIVISKLEEHLQTLPNIREKIGVAFRSWFTSLVQQSQQLQPIGMQQNEQETISK